MGEFTKNSQDEYFMSMALEHAREGFARGEVPVGAVLVQEGRVVSAAHNRREELNDATAHAEILVLRRAGSLLGGWRLPGTTMYVTLEPCAMCAGALVLARVNRLVYGAHDPKSGAISSLFNLARDPRLNHRLEVTSGVLECECAEILKFFFRDRRR